MQKLPKRSILRIFSANHWNQPEKNANFFPQMQLGNNNTHWQSLGTCITDPEIHKKVSKKPLLSFKEGLTGLKTF